jgi:hypothetical protein
MKVRAPSNMSVGQGTGGPVGRASVEDEDGRVPEHGADGKIPSSPKNWVWYFGWEQPVVG